MPDGTFSGYYNGYILEDYFDDDSGIAQEESSFIGRFKDIKRIDDYTYSMNLDYITIEGEIGDETIHDGMTMVTTQPQGFDNASEFLLYLPGRRISDLPEPFMFCMNPLYNSNNIYQLLPFYGLYNVGGEEGFEGEIPASGEVVQPGNIYVNMSKAEHKALNIFFSNFAEVEMNDFDVTNYSNSALIDFAIWHTWINNANAILPSEGIYNDDNYEYPCRISADTVEAAVKRYFDISINNQSVYYDDPNYSDYGKLQYLYKDGYYHFDGADGAPITWSQVNELYDNGDGTYTAYLDVYYSHIPPDNLYEDISDGISRFTPDEGYTIIRKGEQDFADEEAARYDYSCVATISPHDYNGKSTYKLISLKQIW
jgi:hypothetical protein